PDHSVLAAGGFIVQVMPGAGEDVIDQLEDKIQNLPAISSLIREGYLPEQMLGQLLGNADVVFHEKVEVQFQCGCRRERIERAIIRLEAEEIQLMIEEDHGAEANCHFCNETYTFTEEELSVLKDKAKQE